MTSKAEKSSTMKLILMELETSIRKMTGHHNPSTYILMDHTLSRTTSTWMKTGMIMISREWYLMMKVL